MTAVLAREHGLDERLAVRIVCVSTALSGVTIAVVMTLSALGVPLTRIRSN